MKFDYIVIGTGLAGLTCALTLKDKGKVLMLTKSQVKNSASNLAQGGINAVVEKEDSFASHIKDTLIAGANHNDKSNVEFMVKKAPNAIKWLIKNGVRFDRKNGKLAPTREAAHSHKRVLHATDFTGEEIVRALVEKVKEEKNITVWSKCFVLDLLVEKGRCFGVKIIRKSQAKSKNKISNIVCKAVILATGGLGQIYQWTTNPNTATGDGLALAKRAGCKFKDLEFVQFHPTALKDGKSPLFLLSEALRGEGATLKKVKSQKPKAKSNLKGERFMDGYDSRGELAPRDIVARAIFKEQQKGYEVYLDIRHKGKKFIKKRFPNIYKELKSRGFDLTNELIPTTPAVHYQCGGIKVDKCGRTDIGNLFAFGEVACSGVQGANRLASNSLLEAVVFPLELGKCIANKRRQIEKNTPQESNNKSKIGFKSIRTKLQKLMWSNVGIARKTKELEKALRIIEKWMEDFDNRSRDNWKYYEEKNVLTVAKLVVEACLKRKKSLGAHYMVNDN